MAYKLNNPRLLKSAVFGANDGIITTFAVVAGVAGANLNLEVVLILGAANLFADGFSMAFGDYLGERSEQKLRKNQRDKYNLDGLWHTSVITFIAFVIAGSLPLLPYFLEFLGYNFMVGNQFQLSILSTGLALFFVGSVRTVFIKGEWWKNGFEMLSIGAIAATVAYLIGAWLEVLVRNAKY